MFAKKTLSFIVAGIATLAVAAPAQAAPRPADARSAVRDADSSLALSIASVEAGRFADAAVQITETQRLERRAVRVARRLAERGNARSAAKHLQRAAAAVDRGFNAYALLLPTAPAELQASLLGALKQFDGVRVQLVGELSGLVDVLPPDVRGAVEDAISAYQSNGDLDALIAALNDPAIAAAIHAYLGEIVDQAVATMQAQIDDPDYVATLPEGTVERIQTVILVIQYNRDTIITALGQMLDQGGTNLPTLSTEMCDQVSLVFTQLGITLPDGLCATPAP